MLRILVIIGASAGWLSLSAAAPALAADNDRELLAAFLMFGADYRYKGPDRTLNGSEWVNVSENPLVFHTDNDDLEGDVTVTITAIDNCRYSIEKAIGKPHKETSRISTIFDFTKIQRPRLKDSMLGYWVLTGNGQGYECSTFYSADTETGKSCRESATENPSEVYVPLEQEAKDEDVRAAFRKFFGNVCTMQVGQ